MPLVNIPSHANITISRLLHIISHGFFCSPCEKQNNTLKILNENAVCCLLLTCLSLFTACHLCICMCLCAWEKGRFVGKCNSVLAAFLQRQTDSDGCFVVTRATVVAKCSKSIRRKKRSEISGRKTFCYFLQWRLVLFKSRESLVNDKRCTDFYLLLAKTASQTTTELWKYLINIMNQAQNCQCLEKDRIVIVKLKSWTIRHIDFVLTFQSNVSHCCKFLPIWELSQSSYREGRVPCET